MARTSVSSPFEVELDLDSGSGKPIENVQNWYTFPAGDVAAYEARYRARYRAIQERTSGCSDVYNCHGLVFAARRTKIYKAPVVRRILSEDGYISIRPEQILPGDIILYVHSSGDITHSGVIVEKSVVMLTNPRVVSKWGPWAEIIHYAYDCPYYRDEPDVNLEFCRFVK